MEIEENPAHATGRWWFIMVTGANRQGKRSRVNRHEPGDVSNCLVVPPMWRALGTCV